MPAGPVWVKCWFSKHLGDLKLVNIPVNGEAQVETMNLAQGNFLVSHPSLSPDSKSLSFVHYKIEYLGYKGGRFSKPGAD